MLTDIDIDALTQFIQSSLASPELIDEELFRDEAVAYNDLCFELNSHLAQTDRLLDAGRRDEAIDYSERQGNLLTMFERLDLPERELWCELVAAFELPLPPTINVDAAEQLNDAYATLGNLTPLLKRHRLLALDRAPLRYRVQTLDELARRDPLNPIWGDSLKVFQEARLQEIPAELSRAMTSGQETLIEELHHELNSTKWLVPIPAKLKTQVQTARQAAHRRVISEEIEDLGCRLQQSQQNHDQAEAIAIADQIGEKIAAADIQSDDPVLQPFSSLLEWVAGLRQQAEIQRRDEEAVEKFQAVLHRATTPSDLEPALESIRAMGSRFPAELRERGKRRLDAMKRNLLIKRLFLLAGAVAAILLVMAGVGTWFYFQHRENHFAQLDRSFQDLIQNGRWDEAKSFYDSQVDAVKLRPVFNAGANEVAAAMKAERSRKEAFAKIVAQIESDEMGDATEGLLKQLRELAKTREEQNTIARQETLAAHRDLMKERASAEKANAALDEIEQTLERITRTTPPDLVGLAALQRRIRLLRPGVAYAGDEAIQRCRNLSEEIDQSIDKGKQAEKNVELRANITRTVGDFEAFTEQLRSYAEDGCPPEQRSRWHDLSRQLARMKADHIWLSLINDPVFQNPAEADTESIATWIERFGKASGELGDQDHVLHSHLQSKVDNLKAIRGQTTARETLKEFAESSLLQTMYVYVDRDPLPERIDEPPAIYYSPKSYESGDPRHKIEYFADYTLALREKNFGAPKYANMKGLESGHSLFGKWLRKNLEDFRGDQFAIMGVRLLDVLSKMPDERCDPIFQLSLIRNFMKVLLPASRPLQSGYEPILMQLQDSGFSWEANWFLPGGGDSEIATARRQASELLAAIDWAAARKRVAQTWSDVYGDSPWVVNWVGWWTPNGDESLALLKDVDSAEELVLLRHLVVENDQVRSVVRLPIGRGGGRMKSFDLPNLQGCTPAVYQIDRGNQ